MRAGAMHAGWLRLKAVTRRPLKPARVYWRNAMRVIFGVLSAAMLAACATSPLGNHQLILFDDAQMSQMGLSAYDKLKKDTPISKNAKDIAYVQCIADALTRELPGRQPRWEVTLFDKPDVNAFALPGGKIGVYVGIFKVAQNQDQLAAVMGHEISHVTARHGAARVSTEYATQTALQVGQMVAGTQGYGDPNLWGLIGVGTQVGVTLPFGRSQETEADLLGLDLMAQAGFDPKAAPQLWQNMAKQGGGKPPAWLSTHPSDAQRFQDLNKRLARDLPIYDQARAAGKRPDCTR